MCVFGKGKTNKQQQQKKTTTTPRHQQPAMIPHTLGRRKESSSGGFCWRKWTLWPFGDMWTFHVFNRKVKSVTTAKQTFAIRLMNNIWSTGGNGNLERILTISCHIKCLAGFCPRTVHHILCCQYKSNRIFGSSSGYLTSFHSHFSFRSDFSDFANLLSLELFVCIVCVLPYIVHAY